MAVGAMLLTAVPAASFAQLAQPKRLPTPTPNPALTLAPKTNPQVIVTDGKEAQKPHPVVAFGRTGHVVASGTRYASFKIPDELETQLKQYTSNGRSIDAVAFTPDGKGWTVVAEGTYAVRNVGGAGADNYVRGLTARLRSTDRVRSVVFNPVNWEKDRGYVIIWMDGTVTHRHIPAAMARELEDLRKRGYPPRSVAFTEDGGWTILANAGVSRTHGIPGYEDLLSGVRKQLVPVALEIYRTPSAPTRPGWVFIGNDKFEHRNLTTYQRRSINEVLYSDGATSGGTASSGAPASSGSGAPTSSGSGGAGQASAPPPATGSKAPSVTLDATPTKVCEGENIKLTWRAQNANRVELSPAIGVVAATGTREVKAGTVSKFTVRATDTASGKSATAERTVTINKPPATVKARFGTKKTSGEAYGFYEAKVTDRDVNRDCGTFTKIKSVRLTTPSDLVQNAWVKIVFVPQDGKTREFNFTDKRRKTTTFNGMDPRGTWKLAKGPVPTSNLGFELTLE